MDTSTGLPWVCLFISWRTLFNMQFPSCWLVQFGYLVVSCLTLCNPMDCSTPVHHQLPELTQTRVSAIRVVSSAYLRLLIFLPAILISACASSSPAFLMMYSAYKLNKQGGNIQPWHTPFPTWDQVCCSMFSSNCCFLTCIQISREAGRSGGLYSHLFKNFPQFVVMHIIKCFGAVNKAEVQQG